MIKAVLTSMSADREDVFASPSQFTPCDRFLQRAIPPALRLISTCHPWVAQSLYVNINPGFFFLPKTD